MLSNLIIPQHLSSNPSFIKYLNSIYSLIFNGFGLTISISCLLAYIYIIIPNILLWFFYPSIFIFITSFLMCIFNSKPDIIINQNQIIEFINPLGKIYYWIHCSSAGIMLSPIIHLAFEFDPFIIPIALALTFGIFIGLSIYSLKYGSHKLLNIGSILYTFLSSLLMIKIIRLFIILSGYNYEYYLGFDIFLSLSTSILFGGFILYDTRLIIHSFETKELNSLYLVLHLYLDMINLFIELVNIIIKTSKYLKKK